MTFIGHKKRIPYWISLITLTKLPNYLVRVESAGISAMVESVAATAELSIATAVESVDVASVEALPPQATNVVAIVKIAITLFIFVCLLFKLNCFMLIVLYPTNTYS